MRERALGLPCFLVVRMDPTRVTEKRAERLDLAILFGESFTRGERTGLAAFSVCRGTTVDTCCHRDNYVTRYCFCLAHSTAASASSTERTTA